MAVLGVDSLDLCVEESRCVIMDSLTCRLILINFIPFSTCFTRYPPAASTKTPLRTLFAQLYVVSGRWWIPAYGEHRASRVTFVTSLPAVTYGKLSAGTGTHAEQPSRKREHWPFRFRSPDAVNALQSPIPREGVAALPYTEVFINEHRRRA